MCWWHVHRDVDATCFGLEDAPRHFVALDFQDPAYKYFFGQLLLCFTFEHDGVRHGSPTVL